MEENFIISKYIVVYREAVYGSRGGWKKSTEENQIREIRLKLIRKFRLSIEKSISIQTRRNVCERRFENI